MLVADNKGGLSATSDTLDDAHSTTVADIALPRPNAEQAPEIVKSSAEESAADAISLHLAAQGLVMPAAAADVVGSSREAAATDAGGGGAALPAAARSTEAYEQGKDAATSGSALLALQPPPGPMPAVEALLTVETLPLLLASLLTMRGYSDVNLPIITARLKELKAQAGAALASSSGSASGKVSAAMVKAQAEHWVNSNLAAVHGLERERRSVEVKMEGAMRALADCVSLRW